MTIVVETELNVPYSKDMPYADLKARVEAACNTVQELTEHGLEVDPTKEDKDVAASIALAYAENPEKTSKKVTVKKAATMTPASLVLTNNILQEFGRSVVESAVQIRHMVTNKLVLESDNADPRVRLRALELLGKISDVGLFAEKSEVTITHQSTDDLRLKLRSKLARLVNPEMDDCIIIDGDAVDVEEELGLKSSAEDE
tara:strand:+ start:181 stop:780 length:600 start_codon:yes stop_codon:yes gene_type:complete